MTKKLLCRVAHRRAALLGFAFAMSACATESAESTSDHAEGSRSEAWQGGTSALSVHVSDDGRRLTLDGLQYADCGGSPLLTSQSFTLRIPIPIQGHRASGLQAQLATASLDLQPDLGWDYARTASATVIDGSEAGEIRVAFESIPPRHVPRYVTLELTPRAPSSWHQLLGDRGAAGISVDVRCDYDRAAVVVREIHSQDMAVVSSIAIESLMECARASGMSEHPQLRLRARTTSTDTPPSTTPNVWIQYLLEPDAIAAPQKNGLFLSTSGDILLYHTPVNRFEITPVQPGQDLSSLIAIEQENLDPYCMGYNLKPR
jgi:hypothetical protein